MHERLAEHGIQASAHGGDWYSQVLLAPQTALPPQQPKGTGQTCPAIAHGAWMCGNAGQSAPVLDEAAVELEVANLIYHEVTARVFASGETRAESSPARTPSGRHVIVVRA